MIEDSNNNVQLRKATFAGGCFWCIVQPFDAIDGVKSVVSGYTGGSMPNPTYADVSTGHSGHLEAVEITYDPSRVSYERLLDVFWRQINPIDPGGQFYDRGPQYETAIFFHNEEQHQLALASKRALDASGKFKEPIATKILEAKEFYPAEEYHQDYYKKNPEHYKAYSIGSGRAGYIEKNWGDKFERRGI